MIKNRWFYLQVSGLSSCVKYLQLFNCFDYRISDTQQNRHFWNVFGSVSWKRKRNSEDLWCITYESNIKRFFSCPTPSPPPPCGWRRTFDLKRNLSPLLGNISSWEDLVKFKWTKIEKRRLECQINYRKTRTVRMKVLGNLKRKEMTNRSNDWSDNS